MKRLLLALLLLAAEPALAQTPARLSVDTMTVNEILKMPAAKAALENCVPEIVQFYDQVGAMTLTQIAEAGRVDGYRLKLLQTEFDKINSRK